MNHFCILIAVVLAGSQVASAYNPFLPHYYVRKSFVEAQAECAVYLQVPDDRMQRYMREGYPDEPEVRCLVLCVLENLRAWNDLEGGLQEHVLANYFVPASEDCDYAKRTEKCLFYLPKECNGDNCVAAYQAFQCYYQNYGTLTHCPAYVPSYKDEDLQEAFDLFDMLDVSEETMRKLAGGCFPSGPESECFFRAYVIRYGAYDDEEGPLLKNLYTQTAEEAFKPENAATQVCLANLKKLACNKSKCEQATEVFTQCFGSTKLYSYLKGVFKVAATQRLA
ncbi:general odorant-binding protein 69-like [Anopheles ziemanni]|uniref:general odorant-binding protein 69-like n=1 Tax=Anopheles coustani TaxID=139045 RepID=UPI0026595110|nr:general odorant-binding protein 69-like [Anopheles coustani]XP_058175676.1 general odorant-binding protein 69-like [Anopheles ziemanni]